MPDYDVLGYVVARGTLGTSEACVLVGAGASEDGVHVESTWSHDDEDALLLPSRTAAVMLACAIGAHDAQILTTVQETRMSKTQIKQRAAQLADMLAAESGDPDVAREAWIDVGGNNAGWMRRGAKRAAKKGKRPGARAR